MWSELILLGSKTNGRKLLPDPASKPAICLQSGKWSASLRWEHIEAGPWGAFPSQAHLKLLLSWIWPPHGGSKCEAASKHLGLADHEICILTYHSEFWFCLDPYPETHICLSCCLHILKTPNANHAVVDALRGSLHSGRTSLSPEPQAPTSPNSSVWCHIFAPKTKICSHFL